MSALGFHDHNHATCIATGVSTAQARCKAEGLQLTPVRQRVLEILLDHHKALGAYDILEQLRKEGLGSQPPVAYRALDFLVSNGFAHKIERLNAFVACTHPAQEHVPVFLMCRACDAVAESRAHPDETLLAPVAEASGFAIERTVIEAEGLCPNCQDTA